MDKKLAKHAIKQGGRLAAEALELRSAALKKRAASLRGKAKAPPPMTMAFALAGQPQTSYMKMLGRAAGNNGVLVAEGDSWFDYPFKDVLSCLEDEYGYDVESVAHKGDRVEDMAYAAGQFVELCRRIEKVIRRGDIPKAILLSGGGNDIAGDEFGMLLNHKLSPIAGLNSKIVDGVMDRLSHAYLSIIAGVIALSNKYVGRTIPVLVHGYDYPIPDGRGFMGGWGPLPGPWLEPGFREKGFEDIPERFKMTRNLIDRFNQMLQGVITHPQFSGNVFYVDVRNTLKSGSGYKKDWANELHPSHSGFSTVTRKFADTLGQLP